jgi:membrane protein involved in D-alanine export
MPVFGHPRARVVVFAFLSIVAVGIELTLREPTGRRMVLMETAHLVAAIIGYLFGARAALELKNYALKTWSFAFVNIGFLGLIFSITVGRRTALMFLLLYLGLVGIFFVLMRTLSTNARWFYAVPLITPIIALILIKYMPFLWQRVDNAFASWRGVSLGAAFVGISYMTFRLSRLVTEVRNGLVPKPGLAEYFGFAFFLPTLAVGPINPYTAHYHSISEPKTVIAPVGRALMRITVGASKYLFLGSIFSQLSYSTLLLDGHPHAPIDLLVAAVAFHVYLYCNFSGICDMAIGSAALLGIHVKENFKNPLVARNPRDYWNRWHITLSVYMRDMLFSPLSKWLIRHVGTSHANHCVALAILVVFVTLGAWHGASLHYAAYGVTQAVGVVANHYYTIWLKRKLGRSGYQAYSKNRFVRVSGIAATFLFTTACLFVFANDFSTMKKIFQAIVW